MSNNHQPSLFILNQSDTVIQSLLDKHGLLPDFPILLSSILGNSLCFPDKTGLFSLRGLRAVFVEEFEEGGGCVFVDDICELCERGGNL